MHLAQTGAPRDRSSYTGISNPILKSDKAKLSLTAQRGWHDWGPSHARQVWWAPKARFHFARPRESQDPVAGFPLTRERAEDRLGPQANRTSQFGSLVQRIVNRLHQLPGLIFLGVWLAVDAGREHDIGVREPRVDHAVAKGLALIEPELPHRRDEGMDNAETESVRVIG